MPITPVTPAGPGPVEPAEPNGPQILDGTSGDDVITNIFVDRDGDNIGNTTALSAGAGNDLIDLRSLDESASIRIINGGPGNDEIFGSPSSRFLSGGPGDDLVVGFNNDDALFGGDGNDTLIGGVGDDTLLGGLGDDILYGNDPSSELFESNDDYFELFEGSDTAYGGPGDNQFVLILSEEESRHSIFGGSGPGDTLWAFKDRPSEVDLWADNKGSISQPVLNDSLPDDQSRVSFEGVEGLVLTDMGDSVTVHGDAGVRSIFGGDGNDTLDIRTENPYYIILDEENHGAELDDGTSKSGTIRFVDGSQIVSSIEFVGFEEITCFTPGTLIDTPIGKTAVEDLRVNDFVLTRDKGPQRLVWIGKRRLSQDQLSAFPYIKPVRISSGALGRGIPARDLIVSPRHRMMLDESCAEVMFGAREILVAAEDLIGLCGIERVDVAEVTYIHVMCAEHQIISAEGAWTESFQPSDEVLSAMDEAASSELRRIFPELFIIGSDFLYKSARPVLTSVEAEAFKMVCKN